MMKNAWRTTRLKYVTNVNASVLSENTDDGFEFVYVDIGNVTQGSINTKGAPISFAEAPSRARRLANPGDTVVSTVRTYLRAVATVTSHSEPLVFSTGFAVLSPRDEVHSRFLSWYLQGDEFVSRIEANSTGVSYPAITATRLAALDLRLPPIEEQCAIADYLDRETARIDTLIEEQQRLVEMLRERRESVITRAVTRGLEPGIPTTDTGIATLDHVPQHWQILRIKNIGRALIGLTYTPEDVVDEGDGGSLVLRAGNIQNGRLALDDNVYVSVNIPTDLRLRVGDIVICARNGSPKLIGKNAVATEAVVGQTWGAFMVVLRSPINGYLRWVLNSQLFRSQTGLFSTATINQLTSATLHNLRFALPPTDEQSRIAAYLDVQTAKIDRLIDETERFVELARERRSALITAAVTGQIDVRETA